MRWLVVIGAVVAFAHAASAQTFPAGEYVTTVTGMGQLQTVTHCMAEQSIDRAIANQGASGSNCTKHEITKTPTGFHFDYACKFMTMTGDATVSGDGYRSDMTMTTPGQPPMHIKTEARRVGPCKPGETPLGARRP